MPILLEPSQLPFASSAFVLNTTGDVELTPTIVVPPQSSHTLKLHRGHWIDIKDVVRIPGGTFLEAVFADNTKLSVEENSKFEITHSDMVEARICINLAKGNICVTTASHSSVSIQCYPYTVLVTTGTMAKISFAEGWPFTPPGPFPPPPPPQPTTDNRQPAEEPPHPPLDPPPPPPDRGLVPNSPPPDQNDHRRKKRLLPLGKSLQSYVARSGLQWSTGREAPFSV